MPLTPAREFLNPRNFTVALLLAAVFVGVLAKLVN
ncbi:uncharacterized membrane protein (DUF106 family) [Bradyrhizobium elkanii]|uniref:Uncharacterized membrane protein (DUF106 family) n=1 Tax=Bradyrhizobium elkanii TaxID=29448 RepID=A0ABV4F017_BRAEL|nr:uncharacterized membrane protein (DUF106 family) [Bradyrhizobium elkanii]MCS3881916.1 uncharacterized membrane protein (DUF106 family) [Bradyrhizobium elkanii]MCS4218676.1 uncharacterized membrane protein (DUF106 family) [Bradyrhizobium elkanii]MCW2110026.1 uncharacterized membrane protein (DUF106 family) [Bradyrhizobium elkanii]MCW2201603.1 uncharacterized membrane protein (DUF106 family) [Bradyrhizobium elkanii]